MTSHALWLIIPVKPLTESKSRLSARLSAAERMQLSRQLLIHTLETAHQVDELAGIAVISRDPEVTAIARQWNALFVPEAAHHSLSAPSDEAVEAQLNGALEEARRAVMARGAEAILVLPTDLPLITPQTIRMLHARCPSGAGVVIARSRDGGTNALLLSPPSIMDFAYGPQSYRRHLARARAASVRVHQVHSSTLSFDLDFPEDLEWLFQPA